MPLQIPKYQMSVDIGVVVVGLIIFLCLHSMYVKGSENFYIYLYALFLVIAAAIISMVRVPMERHIEEIPAYIIYVRRILLSQILLSVLMLYEIYLIRLIQLEGRTYKISLWSTAALWGTGMIVSVIANMPFVYGDQNGNVREYLNGNVPVFLILYMINVVYLIGFMFYFQQRFVSQIWKATLQSAVCSLLIVFGEHMIQVSTFMVFTFLLPMIIILLLVHSNSYDRDTGALDECSFTSLLTNKKENSAKSYLSVKFGDARHMPKEAMLKFLYFHKGYVKGSVLFRLEYSRLILAFNKTEQGVEIMQKLIAEQFLPQYRKYHVDYKIVYVPDASFLQDTGGFCDFLNYYEHSMESNEILFLDDQAIEKYHEMNYILDELKDIAAKKDLFDPRVQVYCQPIKNQKTGKFDTAETLMRLSLPEIPFVTPDRFISLAEEHQLLHALSMILLNKSCRMVKELKDQGYLLNRISVNFSIMELRNPRFCQNVMDIIRSSQVDLHQIAIELTESQNDKDYEMLKARVGELKEIGMKFYLDDFGSGYSNFDRMLGLRFDVIKFDRSLLLYADRMETGKTVVSYFANMLKQLGYTVLYEGVETVEQENLCIANHADYLQGYFYSKPIPIQELHQYLERA